MTFSLFEFLTQAKRRADYNAFMRSRRWAKLRERKLSQARNRCEQCGATKDLHVHHLTYERFGGDERTTDLKVLCKSCHEKAHGRKF